MRVTSWRRRFWAPAVKIAGLEPLRPHDLRHTAVALWIASGANMLEVSETLRSLHFAYTSGAKMRGRGEFSE